MASARPPREDYPDPNPGDLARALRAATEDDDFRHYQRGRYTATQAFRDVEDRGLPPESAKERVVEVTECDRSIVLFAPIDQVEELVTVLEQTDGGEP